MVWFLMVPLFVLTAIGVCLEEMPLLEWCCCAVELCISTGFIVTELLILWTKWSAEAEAAGAVVFGPLVEEEDPRERVEEFLSEDERDPRLGDKYSY